MIPLKKHQTSCLWSTCSGGWACFVHSNCIGGNWGIGPLGYYFYKRLAALLSAKWGSDYSVVMGWLRCCLSFSLLRSAIQCTFVHWYLLLDSTTSGFNCSGVPHVSLNHFFCSLVLLSSTCHLCWQGQSILPGEKKLNRLLNSRSRNTVPNILWSCGT